MRGSALIYAVFPVSVLAFYPSGAEASEIHLHWMVDTALPFIETMVVTAGAAAVGWLASRINRWFGLSIDRKHSEALHQALERALRHAVSLLRSELNERAVVDVESKLIAQTAIYLEQLMPDALDHFGLTDDALDRLIRAHLGPDLMHWTRTSAPSEAAPIFAAPKDDTGANAP